ncbi:TPR repeat-containing protein YrrB [Aquisphaera giovannonii]|uniref:protein O-GlcNAc transferase n=1 Tax=Aquisphaera giovannonii TaxID=406548 RepID=A0A5B9VW68_9BACT|nr:tetratricopeptide repeat protein [Aquisphaera giovannonii]QEH32329.1 TPR repeat-containing protein YrrB [Aquisphaera giovannonii]
MSPDVTIHPLERAAAFYRSGDLDAAEWHCAQLLRAAPGPGHAEAWHLLGAIALGRGQAERSRGCFEQAVGLAPENAVFVSTLGEVHLDAGRVRDAEACFRRATSLDPNYERGHNNLGRALHARGDLDAARASFEEAVRLNPRYATALNNLGAVLRALGDHRQSIARFEEALAARPDYPEAHFNLGCSLQARGELAAAAERFREAIRLKPDYARALFQLGQVLEESRRDYDALRCYEAAARLQPGDAEMHRRLGIHLVLKKDWPAALSALERAVAIEPDEPVPFASLVCARHQVCDWRTYDSDLERLWADAERQLAAGKATAVTPFQALGLPWPLSRQLAVARSYSDGLAHHLGVHGLASVASRSARPPAASGGRIRIGYLSGDFSDHPIAHLIHGLFGRHDRGRFEVFAYSFGPPDGSPYRRRIAAECEHFEEVSSLTAVDLARRIAADGIDILVDLMGHTGVNRLATLAMRPAPVQVSFLGMLGTTGADFIDYLITDPVTTPANFAPWFTERFVTLPHSYLVAEPEPASESAAGGDATRGARGMSRRGYGLPDPDDGFVFCCFNSAYKFEPRTFDAWMRILSQVPGGVLWLCSAGPVVEENLRREASARGVDPGRLVFAPFVPRPEHLRRHAAADLFLDTLLYNAAATAALSLLAGVPVLTCPGETFASRVGASIVGAVGLPELVARDVADYERTAVELAHDPDRLDRLRTRLATLRTTAPPFDPPRFVRNLERAYLAIWGRHASGEPPAAIEVTESDG